MPNNTPILLWGAHNITLPTTLECGALTGGYRDVTLLLEHGDT